MTQYNTLNVKLSNYQLNKLKSGIKTATEATLNLSSNVTGDSNDQANLPHKLSLTNTQVLSLHKAFVNNSSAHIKLSKTQLSTMVQLGFLGRLLEPLLKSSLHLMKNLLKSSMKNALKPLANIVLIPLGLTAGASTTNAAVQKNGGILAC